MLVGLVAVNSDATAALVGGSGKFTTYWHRDILGQQIVLTRPLVLLSIMLGCIAMLTLTAVSLKDKRGLNSFLDTALVYHRRSLAVLIHYFHTVFIIQEPGRWPEVLAGFKLNDQGAASKLTQKILLQADGPVIAGFVKLARKNNLLGVRDYGLDLLTALPDDKLSSLPAEDVEFILGVAEADPDKAARVEHVRGRFQPAAIGQPDPSPPVKPSAEVAS
jgi:hypothetical protein